MYLQCFFARTPHKNLLLHSEYVIMKVGSRECSCLKTVSGNVLEERSSIMTKLVCFDLDDTLTQEIHSVMLLCMLHGKLEQLLEIEKLESNGTLQWIESDYQKAALIKGLPVETLHEGFIKILKPLHNIRQTIHCLKERDIRSVIITAGPVQVADVAKYLWGFDASYGSNYEVLDGVFTGKILEHIGDKGKISCLQHYCRINKLLPNECIAVGDGSTDIPLFEYCDTSIAINASEGARQKATFSIQTNDISDILQFI